MWAGVSSWKAPAESARDRGPVVGVEQVQHVDHAQLLRRQAGGLFNTVVPEYKVSRFVQHIESVGQQLHDVLQRSGSDLLGRHLLATFHIAPRLAGKVHGWAAGEPRPLSLAIR